MKKIGYRPYKKRKFYGSKGLMALVAYGVQDYYLTRTDTPIYYNLKLRDGSERIYNSLS